MQSRDKLAAFTAWCHKHITGDKKGQAQILLDRLFQAFGQPVKLPAPSAPLNHSPAIAGARTLDASDNVESARLGQQLALSDGITVNPLRSTRARILESLNLLAPAKPAPMLRWLRPTAENTRAENAAKGSSPVELGPESLIGLKPREYWKKLACAGPRGDRSHREPTFQTAA